MSVGTSGATYKSATVNEENFTVTSHAGQIAGRGPEPDASAGWREEAAHNHVAPGRGGEGQ